MHKYIANLGQPITVCMSPDQVGHFPFDEFCEFYQVDIKRADNKYISDDICVFVCIARGDVGTSFSDKDTVTVKSIGSEITFIASDGLLRAVMSHPDQH